MKTRLFTYLLFVVATAIVAGCSKSTPAPVSERIAKAWTAKIVNEGTATVYTKGATSTKPGYSNFLIDLSKTPAVTYREFDGNTFTGTWSVPTDNQLVLTGLNPQPTGTNGTITFSIDNLSDTELKLTRTSASQKTGNTSNAYTLSNP
jgi:hypothetical protein